MRANLDTFKIDLRPTQIDQNSPRLQISSRGPLKFAPKHQVLHSVDWSGQLQNMKQAVEQEAKPQGSLGRVRQSKVKLEPLGGKSLEHSLKPLPRIVGNNCQNMLTSRSFRLAPEEKACNSNFVPLDLNYMRISQQMQKQMPGPIARTTAVATRGTISSRARQLVPVSYKSRQNRFGSLRTLRQSLDTSQNQESDGEPQDSIFNQNFVYRSSRAPNRIESGEEAPDERRVDQESLPTSDLITDVTPSSQPFENSSWHGEPAIKSRKGQSVNQRYLSLKILSKSSQPDERVKVREENFKTSYGEQPDSPFRLNNPTQLDKHGSDSPREDRYRQVKPSETNEPESLTFDQKGSSQTKVDCSCSIDLMPDELMDLSKEDHSLATVYEGEPNLFEPITHRKKAVPPKMLLMSRRAKLHRLDHRKKSEPLSMPTSPQQAQQVTNNIFPQLPPRSFIVQKPLNAGILDKMRGGAKRRYLQLAIEECRSMAS